MEKLIRGKINRVHAWEGGEAEGDTNHCWFTEENRMMRGGKFSRVHVLKKVKKVNCNPPSKLLAKLNRWFGGICPTSKSKWRSIRPSGGSKPIGLSVDLEDVGVFPEKAPGGVKTKGRGRLSRCVTLANKKKTGQTRCRQKRTCLKKNAQSPHRTGKVEHELVRSSARVKER